MLLVAERRRHHAPRGVVPVGVEVFGLIQRQVLDQRLAPDALALLAGAPDRLMRVLAADVHDIQRHPRHVGDHDRAVGGLALHLRRAGIGVALGAGVALLQQLRRQLRHHIAVLGMDHRQTADIAHPAEAVEQLVVVHHQGALVGHEVLEAGDPGLGRVLDALPDLLAPPGDGHVVGVIAGRAGGLVRPDLGRIHQVLALPRQDEVDDHRGPATQRRPGAALEIIRRVGAHEGHLQMRMRVDPAGHDIAAGRVKLRPALEALPDLGDHPVLHPHIGLVGEVGGDDGAVLDDGGHVRLL
jgi:hypothetical protein